MKQLVALLTIGLTAAPALAQSSIEHVAPENAVVVFGVRDASQTLDQIRDHPMLSMWTGAAFDNGEAGEEAANADVDAGGAGTWVDLLPAPLPSLLRRAVQEGGALPAPQGAAGFAMFTAINPEIGMPEPQFIVYADYGDKAGELMTRVSALLERAGEQSRMRFQKRQLDGAEVLMVQLPSPEPEPVDPMDDPMMGGMDPLSMMMPDADRFRIDTVHFVRSDRSVLMGSDIASVKRGLAALSGDNELGVVADSRAFQGVMKQIGESRAYGVVLTRDILQLVMGPDTMGMAMMFQPMARAIFGEIQALGYGMSGGATDDPMTQRFTMYMPNGKQGITALLDKPLPRVEPPSFAGQNAVSFTTMNVDFARVVPVVQGFLQSNPMLQAQFAEPWMRMRPQLEQTLSTLGSRSYVVQSVGRGGDPAQMSTLMAFECTSPQNFKAAFADFASQMGMNSRDVAGHVMYVPGADPAMGGQGGPGMMGMMGVPMPSMAVGVDARHVFMGSEDEVAAALTAPAGEAAEALTRSPVFRQTLAMLPEQPVVAWGFSDVSKIAEVAANMGGAQMPAGLPIDPKMIGQIMGPSVWYMKSTPDGFVSVAHQLPAPQAVHVETEGHEH